MSAWYNEIDPFAAQWLRNLIEAGHIARGDVDERSVVDVPPATSPDTPSATSSPGSAAGASRSGSPDGPMTAPCGPEAVPVSRFRALDSGKDMPTSDTSGPLFTASSPSAALQWCLANRLQERMAGSGSPLFALTWRDRDMPAGPPICQQRASAHRTSGKGSAGWPTPVGSDANMRQGRGTKSSIRQAARHQLAAVAVEMASWPTPTVRDHKDGGEQTAVPLNALLGRVAWLAGWPTPAANEFEARPERMQERRGIEKAKNRNGNGFGLTLGQMVVTQVSGPVATGCGAATSGGGQLNPAHSRWLMGFPAGWDACAPTATRLSRR